MQKISGHPVAIDGGEHVMFADFKDDGPMWAGEGTREVREVVRFSEPFHRPPQVIVAVSMLDVSNAANIRFDVLAENVTAEGFEIVFSTWSDTRLARARVTWQAVGAARDDEAWEL